MKVINMKKEDYDDLKVIIGKTIEYVGVDITYNIDDDYGFELCFTDGTSLEIIDRRCLAYDNGCDMVGKDEILYEYPSGKEIKSKYKKEELGGGIDWVIIDKDDEN